MSHLICITNFFKIFQFSRMKKFTIRFFDRERVCISHGDPTPTTLKIAVVGVLMSRSQKVSKSHKLYIISRSCTESLFSLVILKTKILILKHVSSEEREEETFPVIFKHRDVPEK